MGKYISLGEYNKQYKYIWIYVSLKFIINLLREEITNIPYAPFIIIQVYYLFFISISIILLIIQKYRQQNELNTDIVQQKLIFNKQDINT